MPAWEFWTLFSVLFLILGAIWRLTDILRDCLGRLDVCLIDNRSQHQELIGYLLDVPEKIADEVDTRLDQQQRAAQIRKNARPFD